MIGIDTRGMSFEQGCSIFLRNAANVNEVILKVVFAVWAVGALISVLFLIFGHRHFELQTAGCGCLVLLIFLVFLPLIQWLLWQVSLALANAYGPEGIIDPVKFWAMVVLTVLFGAG